MKRRRLTLALACVLLTLGAAPKYHTDLSSAEIGKLPADVQSVAGGFTVAEFEKDKVLELPGEPLEIFGLLFGPGDQTDVDVRARVWSTSSGRRFPEFGVGTGDIGGYRLMLLPGQKKLGLRRGDEPVTSVGAGPWRAGTWTWLRLRVAKQAEGKWVAQGKAWPADGNEPGAWQLTHEVTEAPGAGRASVWGIPFSGKPLRFDDLTVAPAGQ
jgi:hypothetical protein